MRTTRVSVSWLPVLLLSVSSLVADDRTLLVSGVFADSSIVGPVVRFTTGDAARSEYSLMLLGGTVDGQWIRHRDTKRAWILGVDSTPYNAHLSNRMYVDGSRAHELEYEAACHRLRAGLRFTPSARSTTDVHLVGLVEQVTDLDDARVRKFWEGPFLGIDAVHTYSKIASESPLIAAFNGVVLSARAEVFSGTETWSRVTLSQRAGVQKGKFHLRQSLMIAGGKGLNVVSRVLAGGSWDVLGENAVYGHRYGEFRVARGALANAGVDYSLPRNWRVGVRGSYLHSDTAHVYGGALNASKIWKTVGFNAGIGVPQKRSGDSEAMVYIAVIAPLYARGH